MSTVIYCPLEPDTPHDQSIKIKRRVNIAHIRPWLYIQGPLVDGDLKLTVLQGATELASSTINYTDINAAMGDTYNHGFIRFDFDSLFLGVADGNIEQEYIIRLEMINHTLDNNFFIGYVRQWENPLYSRYGDVDLNGEPINDMISPYGLELYEYRRN